jgi:hypothetical protein
LRDDSRADYSFSDGMEPIYIKNSNLLKPAWLNISKVNFLPIDDRQIKKIIENPKPAEKKMSFSVLSAGIFKCKKCGAQVKNCKSAPVICLDCNRTSDFEQITKTGYEHPLMSIPIWKELDDLDMQGCYLDLLNLSKSSIVFPQEIDYKIFTLWLISTYKTGLWESVSYLIFRGLIESGKSRAIQFASNVAYRGVFATSMSFPAIARLSHFQNATLMIDEIDNKIDKRTESGKQYIDFLKPGYKKGSVYTVADKENQESVVYYNNFGFKAFAGEKGGFDAAIFSRAIVFDMQQDDPEISKLRYIQDDIERIKTILINYRYKTNDPPELDVGFGLKGRNKEIFESIIATGMHIGIDVIDVVEYAKQIKMEKEEEFRDTIEWDILHSLKRRSTETTLDDLSGDVKITDIVRDLGWETEKNAAQRIGFALKNIGIKTKRRTEGTYVQTRERKNLYQLKYLYRRYRIEEV